MSDLHGMQEGAAGEPLKSTSNILKPKESVVEQDLGALAALSGSLDPSEMTPSLAGDLEGDETDLAFHASAKPSSNALETSAASTSVVEGNGAEEPFEETVCRLAVLSPLGYEQVRKAEAKRLGVRTSILDRAVTDAMRPPVVTLPPGGEICPTIKPWEEPVNVAHVLDETLSLIKSHIACGEATSIRATLYVAFTWTIDSFQVAPIAVITSPVKRCGKSRLLEVMGKLSCRPLTSSNLTGAAIFQAIEAYHPTLLIDETDTFLRKNEQMRGVINSGHTRANANVLRAGRNNDILRIYSTFGAKILSGIGKLADTIMDRAVILKLRRKLKDEKVQRLRHADPDHFTTLARKLARLAMDNESALRSAQPQVPEWLNDRAQDNWEPLLAIAELAGEDWAQAARNAADAAAADDDESEATIMLLRDIQGVFELISFEKIGGKPIKRIKTKDLLDKLAADDSRPWATFRRGSRMTATQLAEHLEPYGIRPANDKWPGGAVLKGYRLDQFEDAFSRYLISMAGGENDLSRGDAEIPPASRYPATSENPCGSSEHGSAAVADDEPATS